MNQSNNPDFLSRAKLISDGSKPDFISRSKLISQPETKYSTSEEDEKQIERAQAQLTSRSIEAVAGLPGDLINFAGGLLGYEPGLPGSEKLQEISENITGGYTKPKNEFEKKMGGLMQDISLFAIPGAKHYSVARNIGIPALSYLIGEGINYFGGDEKKQAAGKIGSQIVLDVLFHRNALGNAKQYSSSLFQKADEAIPKGLSIKTSNLEKSLDSLEDAFKLGGERPSTGDALKKISEIRNEIKDGKIDLKNLVAYRPAINEWIDKYKGFDIQASPKIRQKIIHNLNQVKGEVINAAEEYGSKYNPEYLKLSRQANEAYAAYAQSNKISNFIEKHASSKLKSTGAKALLGTAIVAPTGLAGMAVGGSLGLGSALGYKLFKTILRAKSPTLRNHYFNILEGASKGNAGQVIKNAKALDNELLHMDKTGEINQLETDTE